MHKNRDGRTARPVQRCKICGCTEARACPQGCSWVEPGLCSTCRGLNLLQAREWQVVADAAASVLTLVAAWEYGLLTKDPGGDAAFARHIVQCAQRRGIKPRELAA